MDSPAEPAAPARSKRWLPIASVTMSIVVVVLGAVVMVQGRFNEPRPTGDAPASTPMPSGSAEGSATPCDLVALSLGQADAGLRPDSSGAIRTKTIVLGREQGEDAKETVRQYACTPELAARVGRMLDHVKELETAHGLVFRELAAHGAVYDDAAGKRLDRAQLLR